MTFVFFSVVIQQEYKLAYFKICVTTCLSLATKHKEQKQQQQQNKQW